MIPVLLIKIKASDGVTLDGIYVKPGKKGGTALIWLHGLSSRFSSGQTLIKELSAACQKNGIGYFKFNNRGHDIVNKDVKNLGGAGFERFEDCIYDIRAVILLAKKLGYKKIVLAGHSTGANKALYYTYKTKGRSVGGLMLIGSLSDVTVGREMGIRRLEKALRIAKKLYRKNRHKLMPQEFGIYTAERYLSLYRPGGREDVFPYHNPKARWQELKSVKVPIAVVVGSRDEHLDRPAKNLVETFEKNSVNTKSFSGIIIKGANHGFYRKEKGLTHEILKWIKETHLR
jgi:pimeloyl-ACP methyl ester carboxylesterase